MQVMASEVASIEKFLLSEADFVNPANESSLKHSISTLSTHLDHLSKGTFAEKPALKVNLDLLRQHVSDAQRAFNDGNKSYARFMLQSSLQMCIACHTRGKSLDMKLPEADLSKAKPEDRAEFSSLSRALHLSLGSIFDVHTASTVSQAKALGTRNEYDIAIIDLNFEGQDLDGVDLIDHMSKESPATFLVVLSGDRSVQRVVQAMRRKLFEFVHKEGDFFDSLLAVLNRAAQLQRAKAERTTRRYLTESPGVLEVLAKVERIFRSQTDASILIVGETGSGKEFLAQHIALGMKRKLVAANMASIPRETAESILFGHERGAFTGAMTNKIGLIETANSGIFFLDEIGECSPAVQSKLLRVLQEKEVLPLGATASRKVRVQFLAATHRNLDEMAAEGTFRLDLLQRLNTFVLRLPPLRERPEDVLLYANLFLNEFAVEDGTQYSIAPDGAQALLSYQWPGNIRELRSVIQRFAVLSSRSILDAAAVQEAVGSSTTLISGSAGNVSVLGANVRREALIRALGETNGSKRLAAKSLGISEATLYRWVQEFGLKGLAGNLRIGSVATAGEFR